MQDYKSGEVLTDMKGLDFPTHYSQNAVDIIASKYFRKAGVPNESGQETSLKMLVHRMVDFWAAALQEEGLVKTEDERSIFYDEVAYGLLNQMFAPTHRSGLIPVSPAVTALPVVRTIFFIMTLRLVRLWPLRILTLAPRLPPVLFCLFKTVCLASTL